jgi:hypothetical protein
MSTTYGRWKSGKRVVRLIKKSNGEWLITIESTVSWRTKVTIKHVVTGSISTVMWYRLMERSDV